MINVLLATCEDKIDQFLIEKSAAWGCTVQGVVKNQLALAEHLEKQTPIDVVLLNRFLPGPLSITEILQELKEKKIRPVLLLIGDEDQEIIQAAFSLGLYDFLIGTYGPKQLQQILLAPTSKEAAIQYVQTFYPGLTIIEPDPEEEIFAISTQATTTKTVPTQTTHFPEHEVAATSTAAATFETTKVHPIMQSSPFSSVQSVPVRKPLTVVVFSAKGGVGKSNVAVNVGLALIENGKTTVVVDTDVHQGTLSTILKTNQHFSVIDWNNFPDEMDETSILRSLGMHKSGLYCLPSPIDYIGHPLKEELFVKIQRNLSKCFSAILFDTDGNFTKSNISLMKNMDHVLYVMTSDGTSLERHKRTLERLIRLGIQKERILIILNDPHNTGQGRDEAFIAKKMAPMQVVSLSYNRHLQACNEEGEPIIQARPNDHFSRQITEVVEQLLHGTAPTMHAGKEKQTKKKRKKWSFPFFGR